MEVLTWALVICSRGEEQMQLRRGGGGRRHRRGQRQGKKQGGESNHGASEMKLSLMTV